MYDGLVDRTVTTITELALLFDLLFRQYDPLTCSVFRLALAIFVIICLGLCGDVAVQTFGNGRDEG